MNIPQTLLKALQEQKEQRNVEALLIHISTDQVYDGSRSFWQEGCEAAPVNEYGRSKVLAENTIRKLWPNHYILRSSIIYGPLSPVPVARTLFVQFVVRSSALRVEHALGSCITMSSLARPWCLACWLSHT